MKTTKLLALVLLLLVGFTASTNAQFYVKIGAGYGVLPLAGMSHFPDSTSYKSFGMGVQPTLGFGYMITKNIALELDGVYLIGQKFDVPYDFNIGETHYTGTRTFNGAGIFITPSVRIQAPLKSITPYARLGLIIGIPTIKEEDVQTLPSAVTVKQENKGGMDMGMEGTLGLDIKASKKMNVFFEIFGDAINYAPDHVTVTENSAGGTLPPDVVYTDSNRPYEPFGNFGAKVGVSILFGKMPTK